jgi:hypothetical protein
MDKTEQIGIKIDNSREIAMKIASLLEAEKCTVSQTHRILRCVEGIVSDSTFIVQSKTIEKVRGQR